MASDSHKMRTLQRDFHFRIVFVVLLVLFAWLLVEYTSLLYRSYQIDLKKEWFIEENQRLTNTNRELEKRYEYYKTDYFFRKEAKRKLNKKEPGENVIVITGGDERIRSENNWEISENNVAQWWKYFFGEKPSVFPEGLSDSL